MTQMTVADFKSNFSTVLANLSHGDEYEILYGRTKRPVARLVPVKNSKRKIGQFDGVAKFTEEGDGKITEEEFLGL